MFLHGISASRSTWLPHLGPRGAQRAFAYDHRGHNDSGRATSYRFVDFGRDAVRFLEGVVREPAILVGHSLGGMTALYAAAERPDLVRAAALIDPPLYAPETGLRHEREPFTAMRDMAGKPIAALVAGGMPEMRAALVAKLDPAVMAAVVDGSGFEGWDTDALLRRIECPVLLEPGEPSGEGMMRSAIYPGEIDRARALLRNATVVEIRGSGHVPMMTHPEEFTRLVSGFIQDVAARR